MISSIEMPSLHFSGTFEGPAEDFCGEFSILVCFLGEVESILWWCGTSELAVRLWVELVHKVSWQHPRCHILIIKKATNQRKEGGSKQMSLF